MRGTEIAENPRMYVCILVCTVVCLRAHGCVSVCVCVFQRGCVYVCKSVYMHELKKYSLGCA